MNLSAFYPAILRDYLYMGTLHMRPKPEFEARYLDIIMTLGDESVMTSPCNMHLLNKACQCLEDGEIYLEVGCYRGSTLIGALIGNDAHAVAIDDRSEELHRDGRDDQVEFERHLRIFGVSERVAFVRDTYQSFYKMPLYRTPFTGIGAIITQDSRVGVLFLDGFSQSADETLEMIEGALPLLAPRALIILDDANMEKTVKGADMFLQRHPDNARALLHMTTPEMQTHPKFPTWWNGVIAMEWRNTKEKGEEGVRE